VKFFLEHAMKAQMGSRGIAVLLAVHGVGWSMPHPGHCIPGKDTLYLLYRRLGGLQGQSGQVQKIWPGCRFDPPTIINEVDFLINGIPEEIMQWNVSAAITAAEFLMKYSLLIDYVNDRDKCGLDTWLWFGNEKFCWHFVETRKMGEQEGC
jgi:hypothetical protein